MRIQLIAAFVLTFLFLTSPLASAGLGVAGAIIEKEVDPGGSFTHDITVSSDSTDVPMDMVIDILGLNQSLDGENMELNGDEDIGPYSARAFLKVSPSAFHLEPGKSQKVLVEGAIPADTKPGGRYALINIHSLPIGNGTIGIVVAVDVPVRLTVSGQELTKTGSIGNLKLEEPVSSDRQNFSLTFKNTGNLHFKARVDAVLKDMDGDAVASASTPLSSNILPDASRLFWISFAPEKRLKPGAYLMNTAVKQEDGSVLTPKEVQFKL